MIYRIYLAFICFVIIVLVGSIDTRTMLHSMKEHKALELGMSIMYLLIFFIAQKSCVDFLSAVNGVHDITEGKVIQLEVEHVSKNETFLDSYNICIKENESGEEVYYGEVFAYYDKTFANSLRNGVNVKIFDPLGSTVRPRVLEIDGKETDLTSGLGGAGLISRIFMSLICLGFAFRHIRYLKRAYNEDTIKKKGALFWNMGKYGLYTFYASLVFTVLFNFQPRIFIRIVSLAYLTNGIGDVGYSMQKRDIKITYRYIRHVMKTWILDLLFNEYYNKTK